MLAAPSGTKRKRDSRVVRLAGKAATAVVSNCVQKCVAVVCNGTALARDCTTAGALLLQAAHTVIVNIPFVGTRITKALLESFPAGELQRMTAAHAARVLGIGGGFVPMASTFVVRQSMNTVWLLTGKISRRLYQKKTARNAIASAAGVGGTTAGAAIGTMAGPLGTGLGALVGGFIGSTLAEVLAHKKLRIDESGLSEVWTVLDEEGEEVLNEADDNNDFEVINIEVELHQEDGPDGLLPQQRDSIVNAESEQAALQDPDEDDDFEDIGVECYIDLLPEQPDHILTESEQGTSPVVPTAAQDQGPEGPRPSQRQWSDSARLISASVQPSEELDAAGLTHASYPTWSHLEL
eukprot:NODE_2136_length_1502_cov_163.611313_g2032_i0.p1 GENE.NODE_2136_length_1502_cov_163.611313_g2032_i0~~NODE_2136_length_1502_cov_163.611313_g2032_i0.p1  ORF type:complete len:351 (-),score=59.39 NODE_2136_length_1502_cov_163.611313_g2032_i0:368-1420(-)